MKIQILSDLHTEYSAYNFNISPDTDVLILAGDIAYADNIKNTLLSLAKSHDKLKILYVLGNHEFYGSSIKQVRKLISEIKIPNVYILDNSSIELDDIVFIGSTLWSDIDKRFEYEIGKRINDYNRILCESAESNNGRLTPNETVSEFIINREYILSELTKYKDRKIVVITHHLPSFKSIHPKYANDRCNSAYASNLDGMILKYKPILFIHGHSHATSDYKIGDTRVVSNPRGYILYGKVENETFKDQFTITI